MRRQALTKELNTFFNTFRSGTTETKKKRRNTLELITDELSKLGKLPNSYSHIKPDDIQALVDHWKSAETTDQTIANRISILRHYFKHAVRKQIQSNKNLGITSKEVRRSRACPSEIIEWVHHPITTTILAFQVYFGLTKKESMNINLGVAIQDDDLVVSRNIASNSKERFVPIKSQEQRNVIAYRQEVLGKCKTLTEKMEERYLDGLYKAELLDCGVEITAPIRKLYAQKRLAQLSKNKAPQLAKRIIMEEMGFSSYHRMETALI